MQIRRRTVATAISTLAAAAAALLVPAGSAHADDNLPTPKVVIRSTAWVANDFSTDVRLWLRCDDNGSVQGLTVDVTQGTVTAHAEGTFGITCDGVGRLVEVQAYTNGSSFVVGRADVTASLTVSYPQHPGSGPHTGTATKNVRMAPPGEARIDFVKLNPDGTLALQIALKCHAAFESQGWVLDATQPSGAFGQRSDPVKPVCNDVFQGDRMKLRPRPGSPDFTHGPVTVTVIFTMIDDRTGDPVGAASATVTVTI